MSRSSAFVLLALGWSVGVFCGLLYRQSSAAKPRPRPEVVCHEPQHHEMRSCGRCH